MRKYKFNQRIKSQLQKLETYLKSKNLHPNTIRQHSNYAGIFLGWLENENMPAHVVGYNDIIAFVQHLQEKENASRFINRVLLAIRHYYQFLDSCAEHGRSKGKNPAAGVFLRQEQSRHQLINPIAYNQILEAYEKYPVLDNRTKRNKVMLGLMVFQGLTTSELQQLELRNIQLKKAIVYVPRCGKSNPRTLELKATQLLELQEYLLLVRPAMLQEITNERPGRKPKAGSQLNQLTNQLFFSENGAREIKNSIKHLFRVIRKINPKISSGKIIRQSLISHWISQFGIRKAQVLAGHRYVSSTERYNQQNLKELTESVDQLHPLNRK